MIEKIRYIYSNDFIPFKNLAKEEYLLNTIAPNECILYLWQNKHTVVIGRNQNCWKECKVSELERDGGYLVRRLSGGGAVYHDLGNLNFTFLVHKDNYDLEKQTEVILRAVKKLGIKAKRTGRNDITVDERKFSGNAYYTSKGRCYHHGTILVNVDMSMLSRYLNVNTEKLRSKGVDSVKSRVINLCELNPDITIESMKQALIEAFDEVYALSPALIGEDEIDKSQIDALTDKFKSDDFRFGFPIKFTCELADRFSWGDIQILLQVDGGVIKQAAVYSDSLNIEFIAKVKDALKGTLFSTKKIIDEVDSLNTADNVEEQMKSDIKNLIMENEF